MRFVCMHKVGPSSEAGLLPAKELIQGMGQLIGETAKTGMFLGGGGLRPSRERLRLTFQQGRCTVESGPLVGRHELPAGFATIKCRTQDEAIEWAKRYAAAVGADEVELGPLTEPWDLGLCPKPEGAPLQFMILHKATKATEAGVPPTPKQAAELAKLTAEMQQAGVLTHVETLQSSAKGVRVRYRGGKRTVLDGPFAESKELIGGFSTVRMRSLDEMLAWTDRFARIIAEDLEVDLRLAFEPKEQEAAR